jgi:putative endonuclease
MTTWVVCAHVLGKQFFVYMLASRIGGTLYVGVTSDLIGRVWQHKNHVVKGFTQRYNVALLVCFEEYASAESAITREKQIKEWKRAWKIELIEKSNPYWHDLYQDIAGSP